eukprot:TRINITY_DN14620_c0_g1_i8.p1 TRINITY_DN14620_c0_g1~~TRINITY_DN14620_c0_g1_i8.p1  ORF type:complete len:155 (+),score=62.89 TRINITY_DN14620_c0_g1_i8:39-503(+)
MLSVLCHFFFFFFQAEDGIRDAQESRGLGDVYKRQTLARAADKKEAIDKKQAKHDFNLQDQRDRAEAQAERIKTLRELPEMIQTYKETEDQAVKLEFDTMQTEQETAEIRRSQYLAASNHKERLFFLEKDLERARSNNFRVSNRIAYSLRNPMF